MKKHLIAAMAAATIALAVVNISGCASCSRAPEPTQPDTMAGLPRRVVAYDYDGEILRSWEGTFDVTMEGQEVSLDIDGKQVVIQGGIVIIEEL